MVSFIFLAESDTQRAETCAHGKYGLPIFRNESDKICGLTADASVEDVEKVATGGSTAVDNEAEKIEYLGDNGVCDDTVVANEQTATETDTDTVGEVTWDGASTEVESRRGSVKGLENRMHVERPTRDDGRGRRDGNDVFYEDALQLEKKWMEQ